ncbi:MAG: sensor histidine kinase, partial [Syntrophothermus sp.]
AERSDRLKSEFLAQMSHEIRTPISTMLNFISLIRDEVPRPLNDEMVFAFDAIDSTSRRIIRTIDLILNMSQVQTGLLECDYKVLNLEKDVLLSIMKEYSTAAKLKGLEMLFTNNSGDPSLRADSYSVIQIFSNLINNAIKYTKKGEINITIYRTENDNLAVDVADTGIGISNEYINRLFTPFSQEEQGYTRKFEGNGLGLALVKKYCELNDAEIKVKSEKGKGSIFTVIFLRNR